MERRNTKQVILEKSLGLFAVYGYEGVSVKEIAAAVGIKDSSLYKHFESKQSIFDTLLARMERKFEQVLALYRAASDDPLATARQYGENQLEWLKKTAEAIFQYLDEEALQFVHMLMMEQYQNNRAAETFRNLFFTVPRQALTQLFTDMMDLGFVYDGDPELAALHFYGPLYLLFSQHDGQTEEDAIPELLARHLEQFTLLYATPPLEEDGDGEVTP